MSGKSSGGSVAFVIEGFVLKRTETGTEPGFFYHQKTETGTEMKFLEPHSSNVLHEKFFNDNATSDEDN